MNFERNKEVLDGNTSCRTSRISTIEQESRPSELTQHNTDIGSHLGGYGSRIEPEYLDFNAMAQRLGTTTAWVKRNIRAKYTNDPIPHSRFGRVIRFDWESPELQAWLQRRKSTTTAKTQSARALLAYNDARTGFGPNRKEEKK